MLKVAIIGGSGYTGMELLRLLSGHKSVKVTVATSRQYRGKSVGEVFPSLKGYFDGLVFCGPNEFSEQGAELFFSALPHGEGMEFVSKLLSAGKCVVDLSADFRLKSLKTYKEWYGEHKAATLLKHAVYGLPELFRDEIKKADFVANPGCYPTGAALGLAPLLKKGGKPLIDLGSIIIDAKSGVSGAGRGAVLDTSFVEVSEGFKAYKVASHRHAPEIEQTLSILSGKKISVTFTPHLLPVSRGILSTIYIGLKKGLSTGEILDIYNSFYKGEQFIRVLPEDCFPNILNVRGSNYCDIGLKVDEKNKRLIVISAIDNLVKGASGQAVQNMNIMAGFSEAEGLKAAPLCV